MHDHDIEPARQQVRRAAEPAGPESAGAGSSGGAAIAGARDHASLLALQRTAGNAGVVQLLADDGPGAAGSSVHDIVGSGGGARLDERIRSDMEGRFGQSFEDVRVHTDARASSSAESVGASAYTVGSDIVFRSGQFDTSSATGQRTLAHELTHVVQQRSGPVDGTDGPGGVRLSDPGDRFERAADATAADMMASTAPAPAAAQPSEATVQRDLVDEEETPETTVQPTLQREAEDEEDLAETAG
jgi:hypothetical protein